MLVKSTYALNFHKIMNLTSKEVFFSKLYQKFKCGSWFSLFKKLNSFYLLLL